MKKSSFNKKYFEERDHLDPKIASSIENLGKKHKIKKILDVGCGTGKLVNYLNSRGFNAYGVDPYSQVKNKKIFKAKATKLPFKANSFNMVTCISVIEHLTGDEATKFLTESGRVLKDKGRIFLVTPNYNSIWRIMQGKKWYGYSDPTHITFYTPSSLANLLRKHGYTKIQYQFKITGLSLVDYFLISTPLWRIRNSFYIAATK